ncbi:hypothetical protein [Micromonospora carbonacea]|uniref:Uncharacterized protein n=1 Tax=Micromonospora carbonacea TaxID=47853 RepID=A0A1C5ACT2_9ACTN|nr:hypothetical protein [Micromonospora carbonacea]SCF42834.1 hypothetical protein GA0070563_112138 [Micromonospora carbonacea]
MTDLRCWQCGIEPADTIEDQQLSQPNPTVHPVWPTGGDHQHAANPPTPEQLTADSHTTWRRIMETP